MQLYFYICSNFQGKSDVTHLVEIMCENDLVLAGKHGEGPNGKLGPIPYQGDIPAYIKNAYHYEKFTKPSELVYSGGPRFHFEAITRLKYPELDNIPRSDYITVTCGGMMLGESYNYVTALIDFRTTPERPDIESPYFEAGAQLMAKLGIELYGYLKPIYGWLDYSPYDFLSGEAVRDRKELDTLYWANFYGPQYIEKYSKSFFLDSPCWKKEKLPDGGIYLQEREFYTKPVSGKKKLKLQEYFSPYRIALASRNPFDDDNRELEHRLPDHL
jgi:hypothetical protein